MYVWYKTMYMAQQHYYLDNINVKNILTVNLCTDITLYFNKYFGRFIPDTFRDIYFIYRINHRQKCCLEVIT